jgi:GNAT superfamily N-acetyltransferase
MSETSYFSLATADIWSSLIDMNLSQRLRRVVRVVQEEGVGEIWWRILWETQGIVYRRMLLMEHSLDEPVPEISARVPIVFDLLKETEMVEYINFRPDADPSEIRSRWRRGHRCIVGRHAGQIVNAGWVCTSSARIGELTREIELAPDEAFLYDGFTSPHFRGQKIHQARHAWILRMCRDAGIRRVIGHVRPNNSAQIRALERLGYQSFAVMGYVKLGPWRHDFFGPAPPPRAHTHKSSSTANAVT